MIALLLVTASPLRAVGMPNPPANPPHVSVLNGDGLNRARQLLRDGDASLIPAVARLRREADRALERTIDPVTNKTIDPPSGDKHDYMSVAPYWWPNPHTGNGLPYIRRDGEVNPERDRISDRKRLDAMVQAVKTLALADFFTEGEKYAERAAKLLRAWFVDEATKMNPHLRYAQAVPGRNQGRRAGIIETHNLTELIDAVGILSSSPAWNKSDHARLQNWFGDYLNWLTDSPAGKAEAKAQNNHGTWYDAQIASYALFVGRDELAKQALANFAATRITRQIEPDGRQPRELARTLSWHYAIFNLEAMFNTAAIGDRLGIDLWNFQSDDKRSIRKALDWLAPFAAGEKPWGYKQLSPFQPERLAPLLRRAALRYREAAYEHALLKLPNLKLDERWQLLFPNTPTAK